MGSFLFRWPYPADHVYVTGTFDDWGKSEKLFKVGDHFEKVVELPSADEKVYYKFVVDDNWIVDDNAPKEDDGHYNVNNVLLPSQITRHFPTKAVLASEREEASNLRSRIRATSNPSRVLATSNAPPGSNSIEGALTEAPTVSAGGEGAPLLSQQQSHANLARWIPHVTPDPNRSVTRTLSKDEQSPVKAATEAAVVSAGGVGAPLLTKEQSQSNLAREIPNVAADPNRPITRSLPQTDGATASKPEELVDDIPGAFPETPAGEPQSFSVAPLPATGHSGVQSSVTTSKEDYDNAGGEGTANAGTGMGILPVLPPGGLDQNATTDKANYDKVGNNDDDEQVSVNPLPATGHKDIQSSVTTSKEDYEKAGALGVAGAAIAGAGAYVASALSKPEEEDKNKSLIPESSLPMNPEKTDTLDSGPFMNSAAPGTTTADLASKVPLEPTRKAEVLDSADGFGKSAGVPFISSAGAGTTTADLASQVPLESKRDAQALNAGGIATPFISSSGPSTTTAALASEVPLESKRDASALNKTVEVPDVLKDETASPFVSTSGPGTTTAALASQVPLEQKRQGVILDSESAPPAVAAEKAAVEEELLQKVPESQATGAPASAAVAQTSYYGLATSVPATVEKSIAQAHASPEAATDVSAVAEKSAMERELQATVPVVESAGEPAPTLSAATATTAPGTASAAVADLTGGKTANEPIPGTDTGSLAHGLSAGEIAGGAVVGGTAAAGAAALVAKHNDRDIEPPRVADSQKPPITTEAAPATQLHETTKPPVAGIGAASPHPGVSPVAGAALSDGTEAAEESTPIQNKAPLETSEATATEYAPPRAGGLAPGVSPMAAAALSDGTEDPTLSEEPAVQMMKQNEETTTAATAAGDGITNTEAGRVPVHQATTVEKSATAEAVPSTATAAAVPSTATAAAVPSTATAEAVSSTATEPSQTVVKSTEKAASPTVDEPSKTKASEVASSSKVAEPSTPKKATPAAGSTASTPVRGTPESSTTGDKKKKRNRLSAFIKKVFD